MTLSGHKSLVYQEWQPSFSLLDWELNPSLKWMEANWHYTVYVSIVYMLVIYSLQQLMRSREPFKLRRCLTLWNVGLTLFSAAGSYHMVAEMYDALYQKGLDHSVCVACTNSSAQYWMWLFAWSKIFELGIPSDTVAHGPRLTFQLLPNILWIRLLKCQRNCPNLLGASTGDMVHLETFEMSGDTGSFHKG